MYLKELEPAKEQLVRALNYHKNDQSFLTLGKILLMQGDIMAAIDIYKQGVQTFPENPELCTALGLLYLQTGAHAAAFEQLGTAMAFEPNSTKAVLAAGSVAQVLFNMQIKVDYYASDDSLIFRLAMIGMLRWPNIKLRLQSLQNRPICGTILACAFSARKSLWLRLLA